MVVPIGDTHSRRWVSRRPSLVTTAGHHASFPAKRRTTLPPVSAPAPTTWSTCRRSLPNGCGRCPWLHYVAGVGVPCSLLIHHRKPVRAEGHLFITAIAYQAVQVVRKRLVAAGERASWATLRTSSATSSASPPPSAVPTGAPCPCAAPPLSNPARRRSTTRSASIPTPAATRKTVV